MFAAAPARNRRPRPTAVLTFALPESGASFTVSWKRWIRPDPSRDTAPSLPPDVAVPRTRESVQNGSDPVMDWLCAPK